MKKILSFGAFADDSRFPPFLKDGALISFIVHSFIIVLMIASPYVRITSFSPRAVYNEPIIVDLSEVSIANETVLPPLPAAAPEPVKNEPPPPPAAQESAAILATASNAEEAPKPSESSEGDSVLADSAQSEPESASQPTQEDVAKARMGSVNDLLASVEEMRKGKSEPKYVEVKKGIEAASIDSGADAYQENSTADYLKRQLSVSYIDAIRIKLRACWNIDPGAKGIKDMKIVIRTELSPDGNINGIEILNMDEYNSSPWFKAVADSARRALVVCSPYANLPSEFYQDWKDIVFTFYPDKKSVQ
jgi:hypothetical protein